MRNLSNEHGQATTAALILLPAVLVLSFGAVIFIAAFALEAKATAACRLSLVESQKEAAEALETLLALNGTAKSLETSRQAARAALAIAVFSGNPFAVATARATLSSIEAAQAPVMAKQSMALIKGKLSSRMAPARARDAMRSALPAEMNEAGSVAAKMLTAFSPSSKTARFEVIASPPGARTPTYRTAPGFTRAQEARARWLLGLPSPEITDPEKINEPGKSIEIGCAVTLEKTEGGKWKPQMTEDRLLPN